MNGLPLRDIHLPDQDAFLHHVALWWPPAPGWWLSLVLIVAAALIAIWYRHNRGRRSLQQLALQELARIETRFGQQDSERQALENLSVLLRRIAVNRYPRERVASLTGSRWLQFLDSVTGTDEFSKGSGRALAEAPYNPAVEADIPNLIDLCRRWLEAEFKRKPAALTAARSI